MKEQTATSNPLLSGALLPHPYPSPLLTSSQGRGLDRPGKLPRAQSSQAPWSLEGFSRETFGNGRSPSLSIEEVTGDHSWRQVLPAVLFVHVTLENLAKPSESHP